MKGYQFKSAWAFKRGISPLELLNTKEPISPLSNRAIWIDWWFASAGTYYGILKRWTGAAWIKEPLKTYLASTWSSKPLKRWNGSAWVQIDTTGI